MTGRISERTVDVGVNCFCSEAEKSIQFRGSRLDGILIGVLHIEAYVTYIGSSSYGVDVSKQSTEIIK